MALSPSPAIPIISLTQLPCQRKFLSVYKDTLLESRGVSMLEISPVEAENSGGPT